MSNETERTLVRMLVGGALCLAVLSFALVSIPESEAGDPALPVVALGQVSLYRLEVALLVFYGGLLLVTPAFSGLIRGRLPTELSAKGAKFAEEADQSSNTTRTAIKELQQTASDLAEGLVAVRLEIKELEKQSRSDSAQPKVGSEHD